MSKIMENVFMYSEEGQTCRLDRYDTHPFQWLSVRKSKYDRTLSVGIFGSYTEITVRQYTGMDLTLEKCEVQVPGLSPLAEQDARLMAKAIAYACEVARLWDEDAGKQMSEVITDVTKEPFLPPLNVE